MNFIPASCRPAQRGAHMYTSKEKLEFSIFSKKNMIKKKINLSDDLKQKCEIFIWKIKNNSKTSIDQKRKRNCEREKEQSGLLEEGKKMGNLVASFAHSGGVVFCAPPSSGSSFEAWICEKKKIKVKIKERETHTDKTKKRRELENPFHFLSDNLWEEGARVVQ